MWKGERTASGGVGGVTCAVVGNNQVIGVVSSREEKTNQRFIVAHTSRCGGVRLSDSAQETELSERGEHASRADRGTAGANELTTGEIGGGCVHGR